MSTLRDITIDRRTAAILAAEIRGCDALHQKIRDLIRDVCASGLACADDVAEELRDALICVRPMNASTAEAMARTDVDSAEVERQTAAWKEREAV